MTPTASDERSSIWPPSPCAGPTTSAVRRRGSRRVSPPRLVTVSSELDVEDVSARRVTRLRQLNRQLVLVEDGPPLDEHRGPGLDLEQFRIERRRCLRLEMTTSPCGVSVDPDQRVGK